MKAKQSEETPLDFREGVRGKYYERAMAGSNVVLLDPDLLETFPDSDSVNKALRSLRDLALKAAPARTSTSKRA